MFTSSTLLINIDTEVDHQLAYLAKSHAELNKTIRLTYETPQGDVNLTVRKNKKQILITKVETCKKS